MKKVFIVEQFIFPEGWSGAEYPKEISIYLAKKGYEITIICSKKPNILENINYHDDPRLYNVKIIHIDVPFRAKNTIKKLCNQIYFCFATFSKMLFIKDIDLFLTFSNPPQIILINRLILFLRKIPYIINAMDLYPDALINHIDNKVISNLTSKFLDIFYNCAYRNAKHVICRGENMLSKVRSKGVDEKKLSIINNWSTGDIKESSSLVYKKKWDLIAKKIIIYTGNLGLAHDYLSILKAIKISNLKEKDIQIVIMAKGKRISEAKNFVKKYKLEKIVIFKDLVSSKEFSKVLNISDLALVTIKEGFNGVVYPSKFQGYISRSVPIIYIGPQSEISNILRRNKLGASFKNNDIEGIKNFIIDLTKEKLDTYEWGQNAKSFYLENMAKEKMLNKYFKIIKANLVKPILE